MYVSNITINTGQTCKYIFTIYSPKNAKSDVFPHKPMNSAK